VKPVAAVELPHGEVRPSMTDTDSADNTMTLRDATNNKETTMSNTKIEKLQSALDLLKGQDIDALKSALTLIGEAPEEQVHENYDVTPQGSKVKIIVLQRGWVVVGEYSQTATEGTLTNAATIRVWGTTKGLGELAEDGPTSSTKLDKAGTIRFERLTTVLVLDVKDSDKWISKLS
jgi:hypothetical protein